MNRNLRKFILKSNGPTCTYCNCITPCSEIEVDHVVPVWYIKKELEDTSYLKRALYDPHNLYRCCRNMNKKKANFMLDVKYTGNEITGLMARSYLYMNWKYGLYFDDKTLEELQTMSNINPPFNFEFNRSAEIAARTGNRNFFIDNYPVCSRKF